MVTAAPVAWPFPPILSSLTTGGDAKDPSIINPVQIKVSKILKKVLKRRVAGETAFIALAAAMNAGFPNGGIDERDHPWSSDETMLIARPWTFQVAC